MEETLINIKNAALSFIFEAQDVNSLEETKLQFLGKSGTFTLAIKDIAKLPKDKRPGIGKLANEVKLTIENALKEQERELTKKKPIEKKEEIDVTLPGTRPQLGHLHLITQAIEEITKIFEKIGFKRVKYPEVEWDWYAFEALNFPQNHPARDDWETFFVNTKTHAKKGPMLLTPHTSSGQIREMERKKTPPIRMLNIAKCYRRQSDASHYPMFHQFEGLVIDKDISIANLKGTLDFFAKEYFGPKREIRLRPYNFPFTEPSFEIDITCDICDGKGCKVCKGGWLELAGAGMVHPNVLVNGGIDPKQYNGFAFGSGVERVLMMKSGLKIPDLRLLYSTDLRYLEQF